MHKFFMVKLKSDYGKEDNPSRKEHSNFEDAKTEAIRLSRQYPEKEFYILETMAVVKSILNTSIEFNEIKNNEN